MPLSKALSNKAKHHPRPFVPRGYSWGLFSPSISCPPPDIPVHHLAILSDHQEHLLNSPGLLHTNLHHLRPEQYFVTNDISEIGRL